MAIFVIVFIVIKLNVSSPKKVAEKYIKALMTENGDDFISVTVPKKMVGKICSKTGMTRKRIAAGVEYEISDYDIDSFTIVEKQSLIVKLNVMLILCCLSWTVA